MGCVPALVSVAVALGEEESLGSSDALNSTSELVSATRGVAGYVIVLTIVAIVLLGVFILLRVCNIGALNLFIKAYLSIVSSVLARKFFLKSVGSFNIKAYLWF